MTLHLPFGPGHESLGDGGMHEAAGWMAEELRPIAGGRMHEVNSSADNRAMPVAYNTLGPDVVNALLTALNEAPIAEPPRPENDHYSQPVADYIASQTVQSQHAPSPAEVEARESGFLDPEDPNDQKLAKYAWEGDTAQDVDPSQLQTEEQSIGRFFKQNFGLLPKQDDLQPQAYTEQDLKLEAGFDNPHVDETRQMWDTLSAMPEMVAGTDGAQAPAGNAAPEQQAVPDQAAMAEAARRQAEAAHRQLMGAQQ